MSLEGDAKRNKKSDKSKINYERNGKFSQKSIRIKENQKLNKTKKNIK